MATENMETGDNHSKVKANKEIGRELKVSELKTDTIVVLAQEDRSIEFTVWVLDITEHFVIFKDDAVGVTIFAEILPDDTLTDDSGAKIVIFQYLGAW